MWNRNYSKKFLKLLKIFSILKLLILKSREKILPIFDEIYYFIIFYCD